MSLIGQMFDGLKALRLAIVVAAIVVFGWTGESKACVFPRLAAVVHKVTHPFETLRGKSGCDPVQPPVGQPTQPTPPGQFPVLPPVGQPTQPTPPGQGQFPVLPPVNPLPKVETKKDAAPSPKVVLPATITLPDGQVAIFREATGDYHVPLASVGQPVQSQQVFSQPQVWSPGYIAQPFVQGTLQTFRNAGQTIRGCVNGMCPNISR